MRGHQITLPVWSFALSSLPGAALAITWHGGSGTHEHELVEYASISWPNAAAWIESNLGPDWYLATITSAAEQAFITRQAFAGGKQCRV